MKRLPTLVLVVLVAASAMAYAFYRQHQAQTQLNGQLYYLNQLLATDNEDAHRRTEGNVKGIEEAVVKNQNQPKEVSILAAARKLHDNADSMALTLRDLTNELRHPTGTKAEANPTLAHLGEIGASEKLLGSTRAAQQGMHQQITNYRSVLQALNPTGKAKLSEPQFTGLSTVAALANLSQLESEVRTAELNTLQYLLSRVGAKQLRSHLVALYSAESGVVAPGEIYRAHLFLGSILDLRYVPMQMRCNGQPVAVDSSNVGQVRFRAPLKSGPAAWTGTIRFNASGRDTTFQVHVPYRVAQR
ncbi:hypothetical protein [Hymenobacter negativus]|uniref:Gliding motility-associated protein GldM first immunoglobulin-like domain-containing protein n=1 Tax=Hymenobacter negativus TaxID=2795026 RepID=A0ABS3QIT4_9BACT|nr:hypothetical protein [Hymenobacter negativus]MBO2011142.1 hypothetical protein [Hymenobacter negativus]